MKTRDDVNPPLIAVRSAVAAAVAEDLLPLGDLTAMLLDPELVGSAALVARKAGVVAGLDCVEEVCRQVDPALACTFMLHDGDELEAGSVIGRLSGPFRSLLAAERTALNFLCHLSGVASLTRDYVAIAAARNAEARIWDTRKTTPGLRTLEKAAVRAGGGFNHRGNLSEGVLVKDNHLGGLTIADAVALAKHRWPGRMVEVECDTLEQVHEAVAARATLVLCDNMSPDEVRQSVAIVRAALDRSMCLVEASGGINLSNVGDYAEAGADVISIGALTHSAPILDIGLDLED